MGYLISSLFAHLIYRKLVAATSYVPTSPLIPTLCRCHLPSHCRLASLPPHLCLPYTAHAPRRPPGRADGSNSPRRATAALALKCPPPPRKIELQSGENLPETGSGLRTCRYAGDASLLAFGCSRCRKLFSAQNHAQDSSHYRHGRVIAHTSSFAQTPLSGTKISQARLQVVLMRWSTSINFATSAHASHRTPATPDCRARIPSPRDCGAWILIPITPPPSRITRRAPYSQEAGAVTRRLTTAPPAVETAALRSRTQNASTGSLAGVFGPEAEQAARLQVALIARANAVIARTLSTSARTQRHPCHAVSTARPSRSLPGPSSSQGATACALRSERDTSPLAPPAPLPSPSLFILQPAADMRRDRAECSQSSRAEGGTLATERDREDAAKAAGANSRLAQRVRPGVLRHRTLDSKERRRGRASAHCDSSPHTRSSSSLARASSINACCGVGRAKPHARRGREYAPQPVRLRVSVCVQLEEGDGVQERSSAQMRMRGVRAGPSASVDAELELWRS
ncbi:hypothetical protein B0H10DRAFT_2213652 [Mycena sp. CBHHK59/15]|nr:hypothetical protein B0H10DRAFT_2213652 [Mycena sp. CBHHK59/15]